MQKSRRPPSALVTEDDAGTIVGFAELSIRTGIPSLEGWRTGYAEGALCDARIPFSRDCALVAGNGLQLGVARSDVLGLPASTRIG